MAPHGPPHRAWRPAAARTAQARRSTIASRRGEQRGASRQSGADPSLSTTRTCLSRSEVACKRAAGAGEREGWQKLPLARFAPCQLTFPAMCGEEPTTPRMGVFILVDNTTYPRLLESPRPQSGGSLAQRRRCGNAASRPQRVRRGASSRLQPLRPATAGPKDGAETLGCTMKALARALKPHPRNSVFELSGSGSRLACKRSAVGQTGCSRDQGLAPWHHP